jgi:beta-glucanase (GH16 family)
LRLQSCNTASSSQNFNWDIAVLSAASSDPNLTHGSGKYTRLAWSDEFNGTALDSNVWAFEINCDGGGNNEAECYTQNANNLFLNRQGHLVMQILKAANLSGGKTYSSARINTQNKQNFLYGRLESRLQIPIGMGMWPAFWTMPTDSVYGVWPTSGELDIMEVVGRNPNTLYGSAHFGVPSPYTQLSGNISDPNIIHGFHTYALERDANQIRWYYDDHLYFTANTGDATFWPSGYTPTDNTPWPFEQNFFVIFNIAIGGSFGGSIDPNIVGDAMVVDWVRIYQ